jgi:hypothetical protein
MLAVEFNFWDSFHFSEICPIKTKKIWKALFGVHVNFKDVLCATPFNITYTVHNQSNEIMRSHIIMQAEIITGNGFIIVPPHKSVHPSCWYYQI